MEKYKSFILLLKRYWWVIPIVLVLSGAFYWYEWRPIKIRKECLIKLRDYSTESNKKAYELNVAYRLCIVAKGLKPESLFVNTDQIN